MTDAGYEDASSLATGLVHHDLAHHPAVLFVEMTDGFVGKQEIEGLAQSPDERHTLLLSEAHAAESGIFLLADSEGAEPGRDVGITLVVGQLVLDLHVLPGGQFRKQAKFLEHVAEGTLAQSRPTGIAQLTDIASVEGDSAAVVFTIAAEVGAERGFSRSGGGFYQVEVAAFEGDVLLPQVGSDVRALGKDLGEDIMEGNGGQGELRVLGPSPTLPVGARDGKEG